MAITSVIVSSPLQLVFSASLDSTIRLWRLPSATQDPYGSYDPSFAVQTLVGHTDAIWDLCLLPTQTSAPFARKNSVAAPSRLASASADGTVKIWTNEGGKEWTLVSSVGEFGLGVVPTCLGVYHPDYTKLLVGLSDGSIQLYSVDNQVKEILFKPEGKSFIHSSLSSTDSTRRFPLSGQCGDLSPDPPASSRRLRRWSHPDIRHLCRFLLDHRGKRQILCPPITSNHPYTLARKSYLYHISFYRLYDTSLGLEQECLGTGYRESSAERGRGDLCGRWTSGFTVMS
jgi:WD40 repeat protein